MRTIAFVLAAFAVYSVAPAAGSWPAANGDASNRRAAATTLDARTIARLHVRWTFRFPRSATDFGAITANPIIAGGTVYVQDSSSSVYALSAEAGALRWKHTFSAPNDGPNGGRRRRTSRRRSSRPGGR
jgi:outer membrane protein assembly factor BamB